MGGTGYSGSALPGISNPLPGNNENFIYYTTGTASNSGQLSTSGTVLLLAALSPPPPPPPPTPTAQVPTPTPTPHPTNARLPPLHKTQIKNTVEQISETKRLYTKNT